MSAASRRCTHRFSAFFNESAAAGLETSRTCTNLENGSVDQTDIILRSGRQVSVPSQVGGLADSRHCRPRSRSVSMGVPALSIGIAPIKMGLPPCHIWQTSALYTWRVLFLGTCLLPAGVVDQVQPRRCNPRIRRFSECGLQLTPRPYQAGALRQLGTRLKPTSPNADPSASCWGTSAVRMYALQSCAMAFLVQLPIWPWPTTCSLVMSWPRSWLVEPIAIRSSRQCLGWRASSTTTAARSPTIHGSLTRESCATASALIGCNWSTT